MSEQPNTERQKDEQLADITDRILNDEEVGVESTWTDSEIHELEDTIQRLKSAARASRPDPAAERRIRARLAAEWKQAARPRWSWTWPRLVTAGASAALIVAAFVGLLNTNESGELTGSSGLTGAAQNVPLWAPGALLLGIILIIWLLTSKRR